MITISYVAELDLLHSSEKPTIRFVVPTVIAPRYSPEHEGIASPGSTHVQYAPSVPYTVRFACRVDRLEQQAASVSSPSHPIKVDLSDAQTFVVTFAHHHLVQLESVTRTLAVRLSKSSLYFSRDIIIDIELSEVRANTIAGVDQGAMMISFIPTERDCRQSSSKQTEEFLFVIDCSGSMGSEEKIDLASKAMLLFLKSLPVGCRFNIIRFGSTFTPLFRDHVVREYDEESMRSAQSLILSMTADLGGTELLKPLTWLRKNKPTAGCMRQIFLLTDGQVSNVDKVIKVCAAMAESTRIFSFGLGLSVSID